MIASKKITAAVALLTLGACLFTLVFLLWPQALHITAASAQPDYTALFDKEHVMAVELTVDEDEWAQMLENAIDETYIPCDVTVDGVAVTSVGIRPKGNSSLSTVYSSDSDRYSFKLEFDHYVDGQTILGLDKFVLNNIQSDATYMKEYLSYDLMEQMGVPTPLYCFAQITVNGQPWGLYLAIEALEESYAQRNFGSDYGQLYKPDTMQMGGAMARDGEQKPGNMGDFAPRQGLEEGADGAMPPANQTADEGRGQPPDKADGAMPGGMKQGGMGGGASAADLQYIDDDPDSYSDIFDSAVFKITDGDKSRLIEALRKLSAGEDLEAVVDVDEVLRYFACNAALVNLDSYLSSMKHNYYLYEEGGQLSMLPWDYNLSFAAFQVGSAGTAVNFPIDTPVSGVELAERPILAKLLENDTYKAKYHQYLNEIVSKYWNDGVFSQKVQQLDALIGPYVEADPTAFYTYQQYQAALPMLQTYVSLRSESIAGQLYGTIPSTTEGQQQDPAALVDASTLDLSVLGQQGGGGGRDRGAMQAPAGDGGAETGQQADGSPPDEAGGAGTGQQAGGGTPDEAGSAGTGQQADGGPPDEAGGEEWPGGMQGGRGMGRNEAAQAAGNFGPGGTTPDTAADWSGLLWLGGCVLLLAAALVLAARYRRRRA